MALPHLKASVYTTRRNIYEATILQRRNHESNFREKWGETANYFHQEDMKATKKSAWESEQSFNNSMDAFRLKQLKETKTDRLIQRRQKLAKLLEEERLLYTAELRCHPQEKEVRIEEMKSRSSDLKAAREERRKQEAEERLYDHWRVNSPEIRKIEQDLHKNHVVKCWTDQKKEKLERERLELEEKERAERQMEEERLAAIELERQNEEKRIQDERERKSVLLDQMEELKRREQEAISMKEKEESLLREQWELQRIQDERQRTEDERKKQNLGRALLRQHTAAMRRKSQRIREELEQDRLFLQQLIAQDEEDVQGQETRREQAKADAKWMQQVLLEQIKVEKQREQQLDVLFQEEAARMWEQREAEWERERLARERLMQEVMKEREQQIKAKVESIKEAQRESLERREELVRELEMTHRQALDEEQQQEASKIERKRELESQIQSRRQAREDEFELELQNLQDEQEGEQQYEELLRQEVEKMSARDFEETKFGRKQAWT